LIAKQMGLNENQIQALELASVVHDIGNLGVPEYILLQPRPLDKDEVSRISSHSNFGATIMEHVRNPWNVAKIVRHHHERYDGTGYPDRLSGEDIPIESRIIAVAEVHDALVSNRVYRQSWSHEATVEHIKKFAGTQFDPAVVEAYILCEEEIKAFYKKHARKTTSNSNNTEEMSVLSTISDANKELISVFEIAQTVSSSLEIDDVINILALKTKRLLRATSCVVFLVDEADANVMIARVAVGRHRDIFKGARAILGEGPTGKAALSKETYVGKYDPRDLVFLSNGLRTLDLNSALIAPIFLNGRLIGTINVYDTIEDSFSNDDVCAINFVANHAAMGIINARTYGDAKDTAMRDPLTGLYNRAYLDKNFEQELNRAKRRNEPVCVLGIDLDSFKAVNDTYGHKAGDGVLKHTTKIIKRELRDYDIIARIGGDEFVVVLPGTDKYEAIKIAERITQKVKVYSEASFPDIDGAFGVSIGIASYPEDGEDVDILMSKADADMYKTKQAKKYNPAA
ncbi:MAG: diguanylate cyclase, partial [Armatimonadota bacterium]